MMLLPLEIQREICQYLQIDEIIALSQVNQMFRFLIHYDNGYLLKQPIINTNRFIKGNDWKTIQRYIRIERAIGHIEPSYNGIVQPWCNHIPAGFGPVELAFASEPSFSGDSSHPLDGQQLYASAKNGSKRVIIDFPAGTVKVVESDHTGAENDVPRSHAPSTPSPVKQLEYIYDRNDSGHSMLLLSNPILDLIEIFVTDSSCILYHNTSHYDKCSPNTEGLHYVRPYLFRTQNYWCRVVNTENHQEMTSRFAFPGYSQSTFVTDTHYWVVSTELDQDPLEKGLYCIALEQVIDGSAADIRNWKKVIDLQGRIECINRFYGNKLGLTYEGDVMILIDLDKVSVTCFGFPNDLHRRFHQPPRLYLKGFGYWVVDSSSNALFIRTSYLDAIAEQYDRMGYSGFIPLSHFDSIKYDQSGRVVEGPV